MGQRNIWQQWNREPPNWSMSANGIWQEDNDHNGILQTLRQAVDQAVLLQGVRSLYDKNDPPLDLNDPTRNARGHNVSQSPTSAGFNGFEEAFPALPRPPCFAQWPQCHHLQPATLWVKLSHKQQRGPSDLVTNLGRNTPDKKRQYPWGNKCNTADVLRSLWYNVDKTINHPFGNGLYHLFMVIWGMVYYCFDRISVLCFRCTWLFLQFRATLRFAIVYIEAISRRHQLNESLKEWILGLLRFLPFFQCEAPVR